MKKLFYLAALLISVFTLSSCGVSSNLTTNVNAIQTNVVLSEANFHVVKQVEGTVTASYFCGLGGVSKKTLRDTAIEELTKNAELTGSQALVNVTVKQSYVNVFVIWQRITTVATATVVEFEK
ncbi:MAG: hypothetical protein IIV55_04970 [Alistipes sp.]|jgi:uncharacterized protein YbjQ (UPF0145 family)|nr:hypothetical protein [Alistipes sp.]